MTDTKPVQKLGGVAEIDALLLKLWAGYKNPPSHILFVGRTKREVKKLVADITIALKATMVNSDGRCRK